MKVSYQFQPHFWTCLGLRILNLLDAVVTHVFLLNVNGDNEE
jgi:hypothetical protein